MAPPLRVGVILGAAEPLLLAGLRAVLGGRQDIELMAACTSFADTLRTLRRYHPSVAVVDSALCTEGSKAFALLMGASPETTVAWLLRAGIAPPDESGLIGAYVVLPPAIGAADLVDCVRSLAAGRRWHPEAKPASARVLPAATRDDKRPVPSILAPLTFRERQIAQGVASGKRNREIAETFGISPGTVKLHLHKIYGKLGVHSRLSLFRKLVQEGQPRTDPTAPIRVDVG